MLIPPPKTAGVQLSAPWSLHGRFVAAALLVGSMATLPVHAETIYATAAANGRVTYTNVPSTPASKIILEVADLQRPWRPDMARRTAFALKARASKSDALPESLAAHVANASRIHGVESNLIVAVIKVESGYNPWAVSPKGARGLMQLMPDTGRRYGAVDLHDARTNVLAGTAYLRDLLKMFRGRLDLALAGYNAGENAVLRYHEKIPPYAETQHYVTAVLAEYGRLQAAQ